MIALLSGTGRQVSTTKRRSVFDSIDPFVRPRQLVEWHTAGQWEDSRTGKMQRWLCPHCGKPICEERGGAYSFFRCRCDKAWWHPEAE